MVDRGTGARGDGASRGAAASGAVVVTDAGARRIVEQAAKETGYEFSGVDKPKNSTDFYGLRYAEFVVPLVKGMQEQQQMIQELQKKISLLEEQNKILLQLVNKK